MIVRTDHWLLRLSIAHIRRLLSSEPTLLTLAGVCYYCGSAIY